MGGSLAQIAAYGLLSWLSRVFGVLGGYMFATGVLTVYVAATGFRAGRPAATAIVAVSGLASIGWMAIANFLIDSDFKWLLFAFALPWAVALVLPWAGKRVNGRAHAWALLLRSWLAISRPPVAARLRSPERLRLSERLPRPPQGQRRT